MRTLIDVRRFVWGKVRDFATVNEITASSAVERLLIQALNSNGYEIEAVSGLAALFEITSGNQSEEAVS
jgi:hypothetical protein